jgi:hypothetical protein
MLVAQCESRFSFHIGSANRLAQDSACPHAARPDSSLSSVSHRVIAGLPRRPECFDAASASFARPPPDRDFDDIPQPE